MVDPVEPLDQSGRLDAERMIRLTFEDATEQLATPDDFAAARDLAARYSLDAVCTRLRRSPQLPRLADYLAELVRSGAVAAGEVVDRNLSLLTVARQVGVRRAPLGLIERVRLERDETRFTVLVEHLLGGGELEERNGRLVDPATGQFPRGRQVADPDEQ